MLTRTPIETLAYVDPFDRIYPGLSTGTVPQSQTRREALVILANLQLLRARPSRYVGQVEALCHFV